MSNVKPEQERVQTDGERSRDPSTSKISDSHLGRDTIIETTSELETERAHVERVRLEKAADAGIDLATLETGNDVSQSPEHSFDSAVSAQESLAPGFEETWYLEPVEDGYRPVRVVQYFGGMEPPEIPDRWRQPVYTPEYERPEPIEDYNRRSFLKLLGASAGISTAAGVLLGLGLDSIFEEKKSKSLQEDAPQTVVKKQLSKEEQEAVALIDNALKQIKEQKTFDADLLNAPKEIQGIATTMLEERLGATRDTPSGGDVLRWFRHREVLGVLDATKIAPYEPTGRRAITSIIREYNNWRTAEDPIGKLDKGIRQFKEVSDYVDQRSKDRLFGRIRLYDRQMHQKPELLEDYLKGITRRSTEGFLVGGQFDLDKIEVPSVGKNMKEYLLSQPDVTENADGTLTYDWKAANDKVHIDAGRVGNAEDGYYEYVRFISDKDALQQNVLSPGTVKLCIDRNGLGSIADQSKAFRDAENLKTADLEAFDLPKGQKTAYIRVFPEERDSVIDGAISNGMAMATTLHKVYKDDVDLKPIVFSSDAARDITAAVRSAHAQGRRSFFVDLYGHGGSNAISLGTDLKSEDVIQIVDAFPDSNFIFSTIACHGGEFVHRLHAQVQGSPDRQKRLMMMTQAKSATINLMLGSKEADGSYTDVHASLYYANFQQKLLEGGTFGEAVRYADIETKRASSLDGGTLFKGEWIADGQEDQTLASNSPQAV